MMTFPELLQNRRAIRDFEPKEVPITIVNEILQDATLAPSASNNQPCRFVIVHCKRTLKELSDESKTNLLQDHNEKKITLNPDYVGFMKNENFNVFYNAPCLIYVVGSNAVRSIDVDCALAASYIMFSAAARGLGTCWVALGANIRNPQTKASLAIPDNCRIVAPILLGYPKAIPAPSERHAPSVLRIIS